MRPVRRADRGNPSDARPRLADEEMDVLTAPLGLRLPCEARVWWGWHEPDRWWSRSWFPITTSASGNTVACDCSTGAAAATPIRVVDWHAATEPGAHLPRARSFGEMVSWWIEAIDTGVLAYDRDAGHRTCEGRRLSPRQPLSRLV
jgi:hypothetical protein